MSWEQAEAIRRTQQHIPIHDAIGELDLRVTRRCQVCDARVPAAFPTCNRCDARFRQQLLDIPVERYEERPMRKDVFERWLLYAASAVISIWTLNWIWGLICR